VELLDRSGNPDDEVRGNLRDLERLNRYFGGARTVLLHLGRLMNNSPGSSVSVLDIGTGGADIPRTICRWARRHRISLSVEAIDRSDQVLSAAREWSADYPEIRLRREEVPPLPYPDRSFDYVIASLLFHHLTGAQGVSLLGEMRRVARRGLIVADLLRSRSAWVIAMLAAWTLSANRLTRHDGPLSVRRGFRPEELLHLATRARVAGATASRHPWFRIALVKEVPPAEPS
jgi:ubiquinone/menaquinone biosynthesis C-methylase UbiE